MKICLITGSRADWNGLGMVGKCLRDQHKVDVQVIAIGQQAENEQHLNTVIEDGFDPQVVRTNFHDMAVGCGKAMLMLGPLLAHDTPDMVLLCSDRFEILGAASAAALLKIPIAHIGGGDVTEGSIDNKLRYAITVLSDLHFVTNKDAARRILNFVTPDVVHNTGSPALDRIAQTSIIPRDKLFKELELAPSKRNIIIAYHAVTAEPDNGLSGCRAMLNALAQFKDATFLVIGTNSDVGSEDISEMLTDLYAHEPVNSLCKRGWRHDNLSPELFYSALTHFDVMVGNSSAGLIETAGFGIPVVNIGNRQKGRPAPANVQHCDDVMQIINMAVTMALRDGRKVCANPYGDGHSAPRIAKIIVDQIGGTNG